MYSFNKWLIISFAGILLTACGGNKENNNNNEKAKKENIAIDNALRNRISEFTKAPRAKGNFGLYVYDLTAGKTVFACNERQAQPSASCMKLLSGIAGLHLLGTKYLYSTSIYTRGKIIGDTLQGDVTFKAGLDPQINTTDLKMFVQALRRKGIKGIKGKFIVDLIIKEPVKSEPHWYPWDLSFSKYGLFYKGEQKIMTDLKTTLRNQGIKISENQMVPGKVPGGSHCIFRFYRSIDRVIQRMWKNSSNTQATSLLYTIGHHINPNASPTAAGVTYLRKFMHDDLGLKDKSLVIHDGCGLCTHNHLSPLALTTILRYGYSHKNIYNVLYNKLAIAGIDGTLRGFSNPDIRGKIHAKTGTLSHPYGISSLAGYCKASNGHLLAFAIMDSDMSVLDAHVLQRKLCNILVK